MTLTMKNASQYRQHVAAWMAPVRARVKLVSEGLFAGVVEYSARGFMGSVVVSDPDPGRLNEIGTQLWSSGFGDGPISTGLAGLDNCRGEAEILCHFGFVLESFGVEQLGGVLPGDDRADAWVCLEQRDFRGVSFLVEGLLDLIHHRLELLLDELELFDEHIEAEAQLPGQF